MNPRMLGSTAVLGKREPHLHVAGCIGVSKIRGPPLKGSKNISRLKGGKRGLSGAGYIHKLASRNGEGLELGSFLLTATVLIGFLFRRDYTCFLPILISVTARGNDT